LYQNPEYFHHVLIFFVKSKYSSLCHTHRHPKVPLIKNTHLHTHAEQFNEIHFILQAHKYYALIKCVMARTLLRRDEILLQTCNSETHSQCQYDFSCHLTKNSLCGFGLRGGRLLVDGSSDGLSSSSLFSNFFASAQRQVRILATFPGSGFAYNIK